jgi:hypothetical protein
VDNESRWSGWAAARANRSRRKGRKARRVQVTVVTGARRAARMRCHVHVARMFPSRICDLQEAGCRVSVCESACVSRSATTNEQRPGPVSRSGSGAAALGHTAHALCVHVEQKWGPYSDDTPALPTKQPSRAHTRTRHATRAAGRSETRDGVLMCAGLALLQGPQGPPCVTEHKET